MQMEWETQTGGPQQSWDLGTEWLGSMEDQAWWEAKQELGAACCQAPGPAPTAQGPRFPSLLAHAKQLGGH